MWCENNQFSCDPAACQDISVFFSQIHSVTPREGEITKDSILPMMPIGSSVALCYLERPANLSKLNTLIRCEHFALFRWVSAYWFQENSHSFPLKLASARSSILPPPIHNLHSSISDCIHNRGQVFNFLSMNPEFLIQAGSPSLPFSVAGSVHLSICIIAASSVLLGFSAC